MGFLIGLLILAIVAAWVYAFAHLMLTDETALPGKYDKPLWVAAFILAWPLAPFAFLYWRFLRTGSFF